MSTDKELIPKAITIAVTPASYATVQKKAAKALKDGAGEIWPQNGCAANLSALLQAAGIGVPTILGAGALANKLGGAFNSRKWGHVPVGQQQPGDVGVTFDLGGNAGADHIYFVVSCQGTDEMIIADNQDKDPHPRFASGKAGPSGGKKTPTDYFLRAPGVDVAVLPVAVAAAPALAGKIIATVKNIDVIQDDDRRVHWTSGASIDADGANGQNGNPFAYRADNKGLDNNKNAGYPNGGWRDILIDNGSGMPLNDGSGNWYSQTTYGWKGRPIPSRFVDSTHVPYVVVNPVVRKHAAGVVIGCKARITYQGKSVDAVVADVSGAKNIGEVSIAAAVALGIPSSPRTGGVGSGVSFEFWPGTPAFIFGEPYELQPA